MVTRTDWMEKSRLTKQIGPLGYYRFAWRCSSRVTRQLAVKGDPNVVLARVYYRSNKEGRHGICRVRSVPYRLLMDRMDKHMQVFQRKEKVADVLLGRQECSDSPPPWSSDIPHILLGVVKVGDEAQYWICARRSIYSKCYLVDAAGNALFSTMMGHPVWMRDDFDWERRECLLALWWFYARCLQAESA